MATCEKNDIVYIITTEYKNLLKVGYFDHKGNERLPEITSAEPFKYCYFRYVHNGEEIYENVKDRLCGYDDDVLEDDGYIKVCDMDCNDIKYMIDLAVKGYDKMLTEDIITICSI